MIELQNLLGSRFSLVNVGENFVLLIAHWKGPLPRVAETGDTCDPHLGLSAVVEMSKLNLGSSPVCLPFTFTPLPEVWGFSLTSSNSATPAGCL